MTTPALDRITLAGYEVAAPQVFHSLMLFPVVDPAPRADLRLALAGYGADARRDVGLPDGATYTGYIPHALVVDWRRDGQPVAQQGATMVRAARQQKPVMGQVDVIDRLVVRRRREPTGLRLLPLHLAFEGFLALHFGGPDVAWATWSRRTRTFGLVERHERVTPGRAVGGLADALNLFEIHQNQVGVLLFDAAGLLSAFVAAHPDDYRALHRSLIEDFYGEVLLQSAMPRVGGVRLDLDGSTVTDLDSLEQAAAGVRRQWEAQAAIASRVLLDRPVTSEVVYRLSPFRLERFRTGLDPGAEEHLGEVIVDGHGRVRYLKTYRLSGAQIRRGALLELLARHGWDLDAVARADNDTRDDVVRRIDNVGLGYLLNPEVLARVRGR